MEKAIINSSYYSVTCPHCFERGSGEHLKDAMKEIATLSKFDTDLWECDHCGKAILF